MNYMVVDIEREKKKNSIPYTNLLALSFLIVVIFFFSHSHSHPTEKFKRVGFFSLYTTNIGIVGCLFARCHLLSLYKTSNIY